jgi:DNA-binding protein YbaB
LTTPFAENLLARITAVQDQLDAAASATKGEEIVGSAAAGRVRVRLGSDGFFSAVEIDPAVGSRPSDRLGAAVLDALLNAQQRLEASRRLRIGAAIQAMLDDCLSPPRVDATSRD